MRLVLLNNEIFFEHADVFSAQYEIYCKVLNHTKKWSEKISLDECNEMRHHTFSVNGVKLTYYDFLSFDELPGKNPLIPAKTKMYCVKVMEPRVCTLDCWFDNNMQGNHWKNDLHSTIKNSDNIAVDIMLRKL